MSAPEAPLLQNPDTDQQGCRYPCPEKSKVHQKELHILINKEVTTPKQKCMANSFRLQLGREALVLNTGRGEEKALRNHEGGGEKCLMQTVVTATAASDSLKASKHTNFFCLEIIFRFFCRCNFGELGFLPSFHLTK